MKCIYVIPLPHPSHPLRYFIILESFVYVDLVVHYPTRVNNLFQEQEPCLAAVHGTPSTWLVL